jgi:hypothetical protein
MVGTTPGEIAHADVVYSILADGERWAIVQDLAANGASGTISELVQQAAERNDGFSGRDEQAFRIRVHHKHLPKMADANVAEYDHDDERVALTATGKQVEAVRKQTAEVLRNE